MSYAYKNKIAQGLSFSNYFLLRLGRIYPLHLFMLMVFIPYVVIKQYLFNAGYGGQDQLATSNLTTFVSNIFLLHSMGLHDHVSFNGPSWSISVEFFTYIVFYLLAVTLDKKGSLWLPVIISAAMYALLYSINSSTLDFTFDFGFIRCLAAFYLGVFLYRLKRHDFKKPRYIEPVSVVFLIAAVTFAHVNYATLMLSIISFAVVIIAFSWSENGQLGRCLEMPLLRKIGVWSYSIYMLHALTESVVANSLKYVFKFEVSGFTSLLTNTFLIVLTVFLAKFSYRYVEAYFRDKTKQYLVSKNNNE